MWQSPSYGAYARFCRGLSFGCLGIVITMVGYWYLFGGKHFWEAHLGVHRATLVYLAGLLGPTLFQAPFQIVSAFWFNRELKRFERELRELGL